MIFCSFSLKKIKSRCFETFCRGSIYAWSRHYVTHATPTVSEGRYRGIADSASYTDCRERATPPKSRGARANEHVAASKPRGGGDTARRNSENIQRISRARPGRRPVRLETRWPGRPDVAWDWNLTDLVGLAPVILKISPAGPGAGWARRRRPGPARPHLRELAPPAKTVVFAILDFLQFEYHETWHKTWAISYFR